jgi:hypothetical protein
MDLKYILPQQQNQFVILVRNKDLITSLITLTPALSHQGRGSRIVNII